ncbi:LPXTG cell wall anchor domain-containing protein [Actinoplanes sp. NPDC049802]|uniref:LPXTG cell wall anchor domain-containing protein n=1 Tax=Actinoplanes sp. NPDC049802 TaxID=3154742 RepID=UPI00340D7B84
MNLSKSPLRRVAGLAAGAVLGLAGVAVAASPAYATDSVIGYSTECDTKTGDWLVHWTVTGNAPDGVEKMRFNAVKAEEGTPVKEVELPEYKVGEEFTYDTNKAITATQRVDGDKTFARLGVEVEFDNGHKDLPRENTATFDGTCDKDQPPASPSPSSPSPSPSQPAEPGIPDDLPGEPEPIFELTCDTMTIGFDNPKDSLPIKLGYETSKGEKRERTVAPGSKGSETFSAKEGFFVNLTITVTYEGETYTETVKIDYVEPAGCDGESDDPELPVTGAAAGGIAGGAAALLAVGGLFFFLARRRKVKFTA